MFRIFNKIFPRHFREISKLRKRYYYNDQDRLNYLLDNLRDKKHDLMTQQEILGVLVKKIENDRHVMDFITTNETIKLLLEPERDLMEPCKEIEENCRLGLALLGYTRPLNTEYLRVLSVDGGGIRGIVVIELIKRLEEITNKKLFQLFDFICGVSTGSIFICGLVAEPRTLMEGKDLYKEVARKVFEVSSTLNVISSTSRLMWSHAYYDVALWEKLLQEYMTNTRIIDTAKFDYAPKFCCVSTTVSERAIDAHVFRNYVLPYNVESIYPGSHNAALWEVCRCSSAAPTFFGDFVLDNIVHQDGGILYNNPSCVAIHEAKLLWPDQKVCLVSMGTGRSINKKKMDSQKLYSPRQVSKLFSNETPQTSSWKMKFSRILDAATDTEQTHHILSDLMTPGTYFRFNPYLTEMISMTECDAAKLAQVEKDAFLYFRRNEEKFEELAEILLKPRKPLTLVSDMFKGRLW
ncbi:CLUMA_CG020735, isoform A [Clunio marinus]|uniref:CLUMA_CG020735, isoform A n=1 Tax=Clunio marinus TaxID=568069 RepID=A0A1J1J5W0_9DIPT|nr:CLUMA_CG020735, isoform A [Clunio marinus]